MQIRRPRGVTVPQLMVVTAIGIIGGVYIWRPLIVKWKGESNSKKEQTIEAVSSTSVVTVDTKQISPAKSVL